MAKYEKYVNGDFTDIIQRLHEAVMDGSVSASFEDGSESHEDGIDFALRVYERYSYAGGNRVSMAVTVAGKGGHYLVSAITSGGSRAVFFKINTWGEESFLDTIRQAIDSL